MGHVLTKGLMQLPQRGVLWNQCAIYVVVTWNDEQGFWSAERSSAKQLQPRLGPLEFVGSAAAGNIPGNQNCIECSAAVLTQVSQQCVTHSGFAVELRVGVRGG